MNVHKFNVKPKNSSLVNSRLASGFASLRSGASLSQPKMIHWKLAPNLKHPPIKENPFTRKILTQKEITLTPGQVFPVQLGLSFTSTKDVVLTSLAYSLRFKNCSLQNEISIEDASNILITITNNSKNSVKIKENELLCHVYYHL